MEHELYVLQAFGRHELVAESVPQVGVPQAAQLSPPQSTAVSPLFWAPSVHVSQVPALQVPEQEPHSPPQPSSPQVNPSQVAILGSTASQVPYVVPEHACEPDAEQVPKLAVQSAGSDPQTLAHPSLPQSLSVQSGTQH